MWTMPTGLDSVGRMEFSCLQHSFLCSFCSFLVILSTPTSVTLTPVCHSSLPLYSGDLQSSHWKIAALCTTDWPSLLRKNYFKCHGRFSPVRYRLACLQFSRSSWNASCPGQGEKGILCDNLKAMLELALAVFQHLMALSQFRSSDGC